MTEYSVYDVFTETAFGGNPLAVIPEATPLPEADLQKIAREFNFSETTFVFPPRNKAHTARVRIFTPVNEIPFAGHPTIGTAIAIAESTGQTDLVLELGVGPIACKVILGQPSRAEFITHVPLGLPAQMALADAAACLGIPADRIVTATHRPQIASVGLPVVCVGLADETDLAASQPMTEAHRLAQQALGVSLDLFAIFAYVRAGSRINARMFAPLANVPEDPATGSASAALAALLSTRAGAALDLDITQGIAMGRPSRISARTTFSNGQCTSVTIGGAAVKTLSGNFRY